MNIEDRLKIARRTVYALLGPGLHARKGLSPIVSAKLWQTYVIPRNLYGIEVLNYTKTDIIKFERLQFKYAAKYRVIPIGQQMPLSIFYLDLNQYSMLLTNFF